MAPRFNEHNNFLYLTASLIALLLISPIVVTLPPGFSYWIFKAMAAVTIFVSYLSLNFGTLWRRFNLLLLATILLSSFLRGVLQWETIPLLDLTIMLIFFLAAAFSAARRVLLRGQVTLNEIVGAIAIYILIGLIWATLYLILLELFPLSFNGMEHLPWEDNFSRATYFSYVTLTTLGYGDISPAHPLSQVLVYLEAMIGTFYMAVVIASLIGSRAGKQTTND